MNIPFISGADAAYLSGFTGQTRTTPCQILRVSQASDGMGGSTDTWTVISEDGLTCRIAQIAEQYTPGVDEGRLEVVNRWTIAFPAGQDVQIGDRITALGNTYQVVNSGSPTIQLEQVTQCELVT